MASAAAMTAYTQSKPRKRKSRPYQVLGSSGPGLKTPLVAWKITSKNQLAVRALLTSYDAIGFKGGYGGRVLLSGLRGYFIVGPMTDSTKLPKSDRNPTLREHRFSGLERFAGEANTAWVGLLIWPLLVSFVARMASVHCTRRSC